MYVTQDTIDRQTMFNITGAIMRRCLTTVSDNDRCSILVANVSDEMVRCARGFASVEQCISNIDSMRPLHIGPADDCKATLNHAIIACIHILQETT